MRVEELVAVYVFYIVVLRLIAGMMISIQNIVHTIKRNYVINILPNVFLECFCLLAIVMYIYIYSFCFKIKAIVFTYLLKKKNMVPKGRDTKAVL